MILSSNNNLIKKLKLLSTKKGRIIYNQFILENPKSLDSCLFTIDSIILSQEYSQAFPHEKYEKIYNIYILENKLYKSISTTISPQGIMLICNINNYSIDDINFEKSLFLLCENIQDPGNFGSIIRSADAFCVDYILTCSNTVDMYNPKVVRSTAGSILNIPIIQNLDLVATIKILKEKNIFVVATHLQTNNYLYNSNLNQKIAIIVGNEASGVCDEICKISDLLIKIPLNPNTDSLNVSTATSIIIYEVIRQKSN